MQDASVPQPPSRPWWLRFLLGLPVLGGLALTAWYALIFDTYSITTILLIGCPAAFMTRTVLRRRAIRPDIARGISIGLIGVAVIGWSLMLYSAALIAPGWLALYLAAAIACFIAEQRRWARSFPFSAFFFPLTLGYALLHWHPLMLLVLPLSAALLVAWRYRPIWLPRGLRWALLLAVTAIAGILVPFYKGWPPRETDRIISQPGVRVLYDANDKRSMIQPLLRDEVRFGVPDCLGRILIGNRGGPYGLLRLDGAKIVRGEIGPVSDFIALDCTRRQVFAGEWTSGNLLALDQDRLTLRAIASQGFAEHLSKLAYDPTYEQLLASADGAKRMLIIDYRNDKKGVRQFDHFVTDFVLYPPADLLITAAWGGKLYFYRYSTLTLIGVDRLPDLLVQLTPDFETESVWVTGFYSGMLRRLDLGNLKYKRDEFVARGIRFLVPGPDGRRLYVGNFFSGELLELDRTTLEISKRYYFGSRLRNVNLDGTRRRVIVASAAGLFSLDIPGEQKEAF